MHWGWKDVHALTMMADDGLPAQTWQNGQRHDPVLCAHKPPSPQGHFHVYRNGLQLLEIVGIETAVESA